MSLDKKSVVQITILVVLVAVGAGAYLSTQENGLGFLLGEEPKSAPPPVKAAGPKPVVPAIPAHPASGQIAGNPFQPDAVVFETGELALIQSKEPRTVVRIRLAGDKWETPVGKNFKFAPAAAGAPVVTIDRVDNGQTKQQVFTEKYTLLLEFATENNRVLSGKLSFDVSGEPKTSFGGTFSADVKGFRIVDGKPDLTADSTDTLQYLALHELLKDDADKPLQLLAFRDARYGTDASNKNPSGYLEIEYRIGDQGAPQIARFQFNKKDAQWTVAHSLALNEIDEAHPLIAPGAKDLPQVLVYQAAKKLEADIRKKSPKKGIFGVGFVTRYNAKNMIGVIDASYALEPAGEVAKVSYLFRLAKKGWVLDRTLKATEKVNLDTGKITTTPAPKH